MPSDGDLNLLGLHGQRQASFGPDFQAGCDGFANIREGLFAGGPLTHAAGDGGALGDPNAILVAL